MEFYGLPTDFVDILLYTNFLLSDNKFIKHTDTSSRRIRRAEMVASYAYEAISEAYGSGIIMPSMYKMFLKLVISLPSSIFPKAQS